MGMGALRFYRTKDDYWIAFLVLLSRVPQLEDVLLLRLPDRAALARARPQYLQDAYQQFLAKERVTLSQIDSILQLQNFHAVRESVTHDTSLAAGFIMHSVSIHQTVLPKCQRYSNSPDKNHILSAIFLQSRNCTNA